nr:PREDICTED: thyrotropin-releasing hormone-degrading ectoenzyme-like [Linepithema humile]
MFFGFLQQFQLHLKKFLLRDIEIKMTQQKLSIFVKFMLIVTIAFFAAINAEDNVAITYNLPNNIVPHYDVKLIFDFDEKILVGDCNITIFIESLTTNLTIPSGIFSILNVVLIDHFYERRIYISKYWIINKPHVLIIDFTNVKSPKKHPQFLIPGKYTLTITYIHHINDNTNDFSETLFQNQDEMLTAIKNNDNDNTMHEIMIARQLFPCWDEPELKATFKISIKHHRKYTAVSNAPIQKIKLDENDMMWTHFKNSSFIPVQRLRVIISTFTAISIYANVTFWCGSNMTQYIYFAMNVAERALNFFKKQSTIEIPEMNYLVFSDVEYSSFETRNFIFQRKEYVTYNEQLHPHRRKIEVAQLIVRQMAFVCFGDAFLWTKNGFATFFELYILNEIFPEYRPMDLFVVERQQELFRLHTFSNMYSFRLNIHEIDTLRFFSYYSKILVIWRMLYHIMTRNVFWIGINTYVNMQNNLTDATDTDGKFNITSAFLAAMHKALNVTNSTLNIIDFRDSWLTEAHYPILHVARNYIYNITIISYTNYHRALLNDNRLFSIYVTYTSESIMNFETLNVKEFVWLTPITPHYYVPKIDNKDWIIVNLQQTGYYRVNYDEDNWKKLANYLYENHANIHVLNRAQIIDDAFYFVQQRELNLTMFWSITNYLYKDTDYVAWYPMIKVIEYMTCVWALPDDIIKNISEIFRQLLLRLKYSDEIYDRELTRRLREESIKWACVLNAPECRIIANLQLKKHIESRSTYSVQDKLGQNWKEWIYCKGLMTANNSIWLMVFHEWNATSDNTILEYLTCSTNPDVIKSYLSLVKSNVSYLRVTNSKMNINIILLIIAKHARNDIVLDYILNHLEFFDLSGKRHVDEIAVLIVIITHEHDVEQFKKVIKFVKNSLNKYLINPVEQKIKNREMEYNRKVDRYKFLSLDTF